MAQTSSDRYYNNVAHLRSDNPYIKSQTQPPPPLRSAAARVRQQTLGPVFSDEEDGDDSEYIAQRMKEMQMGQGNDHSVTAAHMHQLQLQQQALALQQQYLLQQLLSSQQANRQPGAREAAIRQQQLQQMQQLQLQAHIRQAQQVDPRIQAQLLSQLQASARAPAQQAELRAQAMAAQAQLQAQVAARAQALAQAQAQAQAESDVRARFESQPNPARNAKPKTPEKSPTQNTPSSPVESPTKAPLGRFAQARQTASSPFGELTALLARRSAEKPTTPTEATSQAAAPSEDRLAARQGLASIGLGRPAAISAQNRAKSNPFPVSPNTATVELPAPRAVSLAPPMKPIRQPFGPPAPTNELGDRNFQAMQRKKAGKGLGMLGRRGEGSGANSPVVA